MDITGQQYVLYRKEELLDEVPEMPLRLTD
jgi:hypothetical protein